MSGSLSLTIIYQSMILSRSLFFLAATLVLTIFAFGFAHAQRSNDADSANGAGIVGRVVDAATQDPLRGATIRVINSTKGAIADEDGRFTLYKLPPGPCQLRITFVGYEPLVITDLVLTNARPATVDAQMRAQARSGGVVVVRPGYFSRKGDVVTSVQTLSNEEIRRLPGGFEDVVRGIATLPGVAQVGGGRNDLLVRGGAPSENLYLIDNIETPNINHFGTQGSGGGPLSFVNLDFVQSTTFSTGGFGVRHGDRASSVLTIDLRDGRDDQQGGKATISATQFGLNFEGPVTDRGSYLFSARRSYLDLIFRAAGFSFVPEYWDFLGKGTWRLGRSDELSALAITALDKVRLFNDSQDDVFDNSRILDNSQNQRVAGVTWKHLFGGGFVTTTLGRTRVDYAFRQTDTVGVEVFRNESVEDEVSLRSDALFLMGETGEIMFGALGRTIGFDAAIRLSGTGEDLDVSLNDRMTKGALYVQIAQSFPFGLRATLGGRLDYFSGINRTLSPALRASLSQTLDDLSAISISGGRYTQSPSYIWLVANQENRRLNSIQTDMGVIGIDRVIREDTRVSLEGYYKSYSDYPASVDRTYLVLANVGAGFGGAEEGFASFGLEPLQSSGRGRAYGIELLVQKKLSDISCYGTASLSYGHSYFTAADGIERPGAYDQRVILNLSGGYRFSDDWEAGLKFRFATGRPYTPVGPDGDPSFGNRIVTRYNALRLDPAHSLDLRVDRRWAFSHWSLIAYIDVQNVYNRKESQVPRWNARTESPDTLGSQIGILPSIGVSAEW